MDRSAPDLAAAPTAPAPSAGPLRGLVMDWGGVLTSSMDPSIQRWAEADGVDLVAYRAVLQDWLGPEAARVAEVNPIHALERGELAVPDFELRLAEALTERLGHEVPASGLVRRMFDQFDRAHEMTALVRRARDAGIRTALLSNSWGTEFPGSGWDGMFDTVVISGEVGMRKPEARIYELTVDRLGLAPTECVFVDDLRVNVEAAVALGIVGVHHQEYERTALELEAVFDLPLR